MGYIQGMSSQETTLRVGIVGAGPAGLFAAADLLRRAPNASITLFDRLPVAGGLVRYGVAPDHPKTKRVMSAFERTLAAPNVDFVGNSPLQTAEQLADLRSRFDAVILACGAEEDRPLPLPGADLPHVFGSTRFVGWYTGHPDQASLHPPLTGTRAVVVGNGNVALDVARILTRPTETLTGTDIAPHALAALRESRIREVIILGRRGPAHSSFRPPEIKELLGFDHVECTTNTESFALAPEDSEVLATSDRRLAAQVVDLLAPLPDSPSDSGRPHIRFRFLTTPTAFTPAGLTIQSTELTGPAIQRRATPVGKEDSLDAGLVVLCTGHRSRPIPGCPFDHALGRIPNDAGRVHGEPGLYVTGWIRRGPEGLIGTNKRDAQETVSALLEDWAQSLNP